jgi:hypothetical protein
MKLFKLVPFLVLIGIFAFSHTSCKKDKLLSTGGELRYSLDTLTFDTVFTSLGSFTAQVKIFNLQDQKINISSVRLENTDGPFFHINVNGVSGTEVNNIEVAAHDSIYVFATVKIDPKNQDNPFVINGKVIATLNGKDYALPLIAYGQDAHYVIGDTALQTQTWLTDRPYVLMHRVFVDENQTLTIPAGCRIYMHADSRLYMLGTLKAIGTKKDSIIFQGDRLDRKYFGNEGYPGEWGGLYFFPGSNNNQLDYVILKNCGNSTKFGNGAAAPAAIQVTDTIIQNVPTVTIKHTIIENSIGYGILCYSACVDAENCLVNTCGAFGLAIQQGGVYNFNNCDFVTYGTNKVNHIDNPTVAILNYRDIDDVNYISGALDAQLRNCIIWGSMDTEFYAGSKGATAFNVRVENCLIKGYIPNGVTNANCILNKDPQFKSYSTWDYRPQSGSPVIDNGEVVPGIIDDLDGNPRGGVPDIGCYEYK